jgi:anti-sigma regulatory factor (Ser/Thr protein kinase)
MLSIPLGHGPRAAGTARRRVHALLVGHGWDDDRIAEAQLVVSELVTNAVCHALPPVALHLVVHPAPPADGAAPVRPGSLHIRVTDGGPDLRHPDSRPDDEHGRGTDIVGILTARHGSARDGRWATLSA